MKRMTTIIVFTVCVLAIGSWSYAQGKGNCQRAAASNSGQGINYVDKDGDGICDNAGIRGAGNGRGQGHRFRSGKGPGNARQHGPRYVDENGDGVCDNYETSQKKTK